LQHIIIIVAGKAYPRFGNLPRHRRPSFLHAGHHPPKPPINVVVKPARPKDSVIAARACNKIVAVIGPRLIAAG